MNGVEAHGDAGDGDGPPHLTESEQRQLEAEVRAVLAEPPGDGFPFTTPENAPFNESADPELRRYTSMRRLYSEALGLNQAYAEVADELGRADAEQKRQRNSRYRKTKRSWLDDVLILGADPEAEGSDEEAPITEDDYQTMRRIHRRKAVWREQARTIDSDRVAKCRVQTFIPFKETLDAAAEKQSVLQSNTRRTVRRQLDTSSEAQRAVAHAVSAAMQPIRKTTWVPLRNPRRKPGHKGAAPSAAAPPSRKHKKKKRSSANRGAVLTTKRPRTEGEAAVADGVRIPLGAQLRAFQDVGTMGRAEILRELAALQAEVDAQMPEPTPALPDSTVAAADADAERDRGAPKAKARSKAPPTPQRSLESIAKKQAKLWSAVAKKDILRAQKQYATGHSNTVNSAKKVADLCRKRVKHAAYQSQSRTRQKSRQCRKLLTEMMSFWRKNEKLERENRKKEEKARLEQRKREEEERELKRQQRKFNFLITQTELYAHFMANKMGKGDEKALVEGQEAILSKLKDTPNVDPEEGEDSDEVLRQKAIDAAQAAMARQQAQIRQFDSAVHKGPAGSDEVQGDAQDHFDRTFSLAEPSLGAAHKAFEQPKLLNGTLKSYQLKGVNWLANLYTQGINGILADEMGLGKTVQSITTLAHLAESENIWGPFLIVSPASTLHNWCQEFTKFVPKFKVLPYWGTQADRKVIRKFWKPADLYKKDASFHVLITSYEMVVRDEKFFHKIQWQYMILDEAQAIKSSSSARWNTLLKFPCRNRLLLTGTPIQNTMAELWALLHFIMPTLFDSHLEFNDWFSKDIESHAQDNKTSKLTQSQLSRLHMILKPFMLRRIKRGVEHELAEKIEIELDCGLSARQRQKYSALKQHIKLADLVSASGDKQSKHLLNLVMQFRKVCNHPNLFEPQETRSPFAFEAPRWSPNALDVRPSDTVSSSTANAISYAIPRLVYHSVVLPGAFDEHPLPVDECSRWSRKHGLFSAHAVAESIKEPGSGLGFTRLCDVSPAELTELCWGSFLDRCLLALLAEHHAVHHHQLHAKPLVPARRMVCLSAADLRADCRLSAGLLFHRDAFFAAGYVRDPPARMLRLLCYLPAALACPIAWVCSHRGALILQGRLSSGLGYSVGTTGLLTNHSALGRGTTRRLLAAQAVELCPELGLLGSARPPLGWSFLRPPSMEQVIADSGKLATLDRLLKQLQREGHRVLIYSQMTRMINLLEDYLGYRRIRYIRLDGNSKISDRRDMVSDFQSRDDIFAFLLSTRAGGLGITLTAADTVIFYDSDWNPTVDQQAMDRAHRLGQTKQVTVYRLITKGTVEETILKRAKQKSEIQRMVISGGEFNPSSAQNAGMDKKEMVSLLLDDAEIAASLEERRAADEARKASISKKVKASRAKKKREQEEAVAEAEAEAVAGAEEKAAQAPTQAP